ncbi:hypothetical protein DB30_03736 [Enhygromyxa salina]|uniref:Uncharacterized protein n=1 Tax=Enhygromyxa salina TaxID=215803 RepID=A0A0C1ZHR7_9BACT|nr:hypothetical protein DB30_03736 [Enhygromyxa salina]
MEDLRECAGGQRLIEPVLEQREIGAAGDLLLPSVIEREAATAEHSL